MTVEAFTDRVARIGDPLLLETLPQLATLQLNITRHCNLSCKHCHIMAGPNCCEMMNRADLEAALAYYAAAGLSVIDITGGAPELHPDYEWLLDAAATAAAGNVGATVEAAEGAEGAATVEAAATDAEAPVGKVITRTNLVILTLPEYAHLPTFWAKRGVEVVASLPGYEARSTDRQRGEGVFEKALQGFKLLNDIGYGKGLKNEDGMPLTLNLVENPGGAFLPPAQASAEREFKEHLTNNYDLHFDHLLTITNNPLGRFRDFLEQRGLLDGYLTRLAAAFNPDTVANMMCRSQISVGWDGRLFDCDFNQAANLPIASSEIGAASIAELAVSGGKGTPRKIAFGDHCYACTAGAGSSCGGATT
jgi:radical SAM/Cys-rich protein